MKNSILLGVLFGAASVQASSMSLSITNAIEVSPTFHPRDHMVVWEGAPFTVPDGMRFHTVHVVGTSASLSFNGARESGMGPLPLSLPAEAGTVVKVSDGATAAGVAYARGFLVDA